MHVGSFRLGLDIPTHTVLSNQDLISLIFRPTSFFGFPEIYRYGSRVAIYDIWEYLLEAGVDRLGRRGEGYPVCRDERKGVER